MIRSLIILLLIVGCVFAQGTDNSLIDRMLLIDGTEYEGEYISMNEDKIIFKPSGYPAGQSVDKSKVEIVKLSDRTIIYDRKTHKNSEARFGGTKETLGGGLIAIGGVLLYSNIDKEISDYNSLEEYSDSIKSTSKFGYGLIIVGGVLVFMGI